MRLTIWPGEAVVRLLPWYLRRQAWRMARELRGVYLTANGSLGPNPSGAQCVNVCNEFWRRVGASQHHGNATDWLSTPGRGQRWLPMSTSLRLRAGDCVVFASGPLSPEGHVDIVLEGSRRPYLGLDQNWPTGAPVELREHFQEQAAGVIRIRHL